MSKDAERRFFESTTYRFIEPEEVTFAAARTGLEYWRRCRRTRLFPARTDMAPREIAGALAHMTLVKVTGSDFLYRIAGDGIVRAYNVQLQNRLVSEIAREEPGFDRIVRPLFQRVIDTRAPLALRGTTGRDVTAANFTDYESLLLPLGPADDTVDHIATFTNYVSHLSGSRGP